MGLPPQRSGEREDGNYLHLDVVLPRFSSTHYDSGGYLPVEGYKARHTKPRFACVCGGCVLPKWSSNRSSNREIPRPYPRPVQLLLAHSVWAKAQTRQHTYLVSLTRAGPRRSRSDHTHPASRIFTFAEHSFELRAEKSGRIT